jgi:hypothetical protein
MTSARRKRFHVIVLSLGFAIPAAFDLSGPARAVGGENPALATKGASSPLLDKGPLDDIRKPLQSIFQFTFDGPNLLVDRKAREAAAKDAPKPRDPFADNPAMRKMMERKEVRDALKLQEAMMGPQLSVETLFAQIQTAAGPAGSSSTSSNDDRQSAFSAEKLTGVLASRSGGDTVRLTFTELVAPGRTLEFHVEGRKAYRIQLSHPNGDTILVRLAENGRFAAVAMVGEITFAGQAESFLALYKEHRTGFETHVVPALLAAGVEIVPAPSSPVVRKVVLGVLARTPEQTAEGKKTLADLESNDFEARQKATCELNERFALYQDLIQERLGNEPSLETRTRLQEVLARQADADRTGRALAVLGAVRDPRFLISLLDHLDPKEAALVTARLETITGEKWGDDRAAWRAWARKTLK